MTDVIGTDASVGVAGTDPSVDAARMRTLTSDETPGSDRKSVV